MYSPPPRKPQPKGKPARAPKQRPSVKRPLLIGAGIVIAIALAWLLWPSSYSNVRNLASGGTTIVAFGDSLTAGYGAGRGEDYPSRLSAKIGVPVENAGVSGNTTDDALARIGPDVLERNPRIVIVGLGGNDFLRSVPIETTEANLRSIVRQVQQAGAMVVLLGFRFPSLKANYSDMYERVAKEEGCLYIANLLGGILSKENLRSDAIHPNAKGYEIFADRVAGPLKKLLEKADASR